MDENGDLVGLWLYLLDGEEALASHRECEDVRQVLSKRGISGHNASLVFEFGDGDCTVATAARARKRRRD